MAPQMTNEEAERMRQILAAHDATNGGKGIKEIDLANPPKEQYQHKEYPLHMAHPNGKTKVAKNPQEEDALARKGYLRPQEHRAHVASLPKPDAEDDEEIDETEGLDGEAREELERLNAAAPTNSKPAKAKKAPKPESQQ